MLMATCCTFANCELVEHNARARCQAITRAQGLQPTFRCPSVAEHVCTPIPCIPTLPVPAWQRQAASEVAALHRKKETWMDLLRCLSSQPQAAAQATALSLGAYHTVALMAQNQGDPADLQLFAFGRGEHTRPVVLARKSALAELRHCLDMSG